MRIARILGGLVCCVALFGSVQAADGTEERKVENPVAGVSGARRRAAQGSQALRVEMVPNPDDDGEHSPLVTPTAASGKGGRRVGHRRINNAKWLPVSDGDDSLEEVKPAAPAVHLRAHRHPTSGVVQTTCVGPNGSPTTLAGGGALPPDQQRKSVVGETHSRMTNLQAVQNKLKNMVSDAKDGRVVFTGKANHEHLCTVLAEHADLRLPVPIEVLRRKYLPELCVALDDETDEEHKRILKAAITHLEGRLDSAPAGSKNIYLRAEREDISGLGQDHVDEMRADAVLRAYTDFKTVVPSQTAQSYIVRLGSAIQNSRNEYTAVLGCKKLGWKNAKIGFCTAFAFIGVAGLYPVGVSMKYFFSSGGRQNENRWANLHNELVRLRDLVSPTPVQQERIADLERQLKVIVNKRPLGFLGTHSINFDMKAVTVAFAFMVVAGLVGGVLLPFAIKSKNKAKAHNERYEGLSAGFIASVESKWGLTNTVADATGKPKVV